MIPEVAVKVLASLNATARTADTSITRSFVAWDVEYDEVSCKVILRSPSCLFASGLVGGACLSAVCASMLPGGDKSQLCQFDSTLSGFRIERL